jgi:hypothetical protein
VSRDGDVAYAFPEDFASRIARKSVLARSRPLLDKLRSSGAYLLRVTFGTALIASVLLVWTALTVLASGNRDDDRRRGGGGGMQCGSLGWLCWGAGGGAPCLPACLPACAPCPLGRSRCHAPPAPGHLSAGDWPLTAPPSVPARNAQSACS